MPLNSQFLINPIVANSEIVTKVLTPENLKIRKTNKSEKNDKEEEEVSERTKEKQRAKHNSANLNSGCMIDITV